MRYLFFLLFFLIPHKAFALCLGPTLSGVPGTLTYSGTAGEYSVYDPVEHMQNVTFQVKSVASIGGCKYYMVLSAGQSGTAAARKMDLSGTKLDYNVYTTPSKSSILNSSGNYNAANVLSGNFPYILNLLQTNDASFSWTIPPLQSTKSDPSRFQDNSLTLNLYGELALGIYTLADSKTITFRSKVESDIDLSLVDTGGALDLGDTTQTLDFGTLSSGQILSYDTIIRSNSGYIMTMQSQNGQKLVHQNYPTVNASVPYTMTLAGGSVNLSSGSAVQAASSTGVTSAIGERLQTKFTIGTMTGAEPTGIYKDTITVTISAN